MPSNINEMLGYAPDARLLIVNVDDYGMCHAINAATLRVIRSGLASSCTVMTPCAWSLHGLQQLQENPQIPFGVHLTAISEQPHYRWGPLSGRQAAATLVDESGYFYPLARIEEFLARADVAELEQEFRAQIEFVLALGLRPTHLDSHCGVHVRRDTIFDCVYGLAKEYGLALRVGDAKFRTRLRERQHPTDDHQFLDSYDLALDGKLDTYIRLLRELPPGLTEWGVHPAIDSAELRAIGPSWPVRTSDYEFLMSPDAQEVVQAEGIIILDYRPLQDLWRAVGCH